MSSCLSGGGRAYRIETLDLEIIKSPSTTTSWISNHSSSSPSSTLSESSNCPLAIYTRKPRTPRKRPNQTYNEAAAILSTAYPKIFPSHPFSKLHDHTKNPALFEPSDLLMPFRMLDNSGFLLDSPSAQRRPAVFEPKGFNLNPCQSPGEINSSEICNEFRDEGDFDAESMLDEEIEGGIESIMGSTDTGMGNDPNPDCNPYSNANTNNFCYGYPVGLGFEFGYGMRRQMRAMRNGDECDWWRFPCVNIVDISPKIGRIPAEKKKKNKVEIKGEKQNSGGGEEEGVNPPPIAGLLLKLNYDSVLNDWSDKGCPFPGDSPAAQSAGKDFQGRAALIELLLENENGGVREASVQRYKEKRRTRLFSKKIRYQVRKVNADRRPRMKGRFVRTPNSSDD